MQRFFDYSWSLKRHTLPLVIGLHFCHTDAVSTPWGAYNPLRMKAPEVSLHKFPYPPSQAPINSKVGRSNIDKASCSSMQLQDLSSFKRCYGRPKATAIECSNHSPTEPHSNLIIPYMNSMHPFIPSNHPFHPSINPSIDPSIYPGKLSETIPSYPS